MTYTAGQLREWAKEWDNDGGFSVAEVFRAHAAALEELERLKAPVEGEIAEVVRDAVALVSLWPSVRQLQDGFMNGDPKFTRWDHAVRDESIRLSPAIGRIAETIERLAARDSALTYFTKLAQRGELEAISRAERAEAALAESERKWKLLKHHSECMAASIEQEYDGEEHLRDYRTDFPVAVVRAEFKE